MLVDDPDASSHLSVSPTASPPAVSVDDEEPGALGTDDGLPQCRPCSLEPHAGEAVVEQREFWVDPFAAEVWDYNADQEYESTNGVKTRGGSFDGPGPTIVDGMVYVNSGYGFQGAMGGNALIAFSVNGE